MNFNQSNKLENYLDSNPDFLAQYLQRRMQVAVTSYLENNPGFLNEYLQEKIVKDNVSAPDINGAQQSIAQESLKMDEKRSQCKRKIEEYSGNESCSHSSLFQKHGFKNKITSSAPRPCQFTLHGQQSANNNRKSFINSTGRYKYRELH